jgi:hypothetical protein
MMAGTPPLEKGSGWMEPLPFSFAVPRGGLLAFGERN